MCTCISIKDTSYFLINFDREDFCSNSIKQVILCNVDPCLKGDLPNEKVLLPLHKGLISTALVPSVHPCSGKRGAEGQENEKSILLE